MQNLINQTKNEEVIIINLITPINYAITHVEKHWVPQCILGNALWLVDSVKWCIQGFVFTLTQGIGSYFSENQNLSINDNLDNHIVFLSEKLSKSTGKDLESSKIQVMRLKKLIEDYIIIQLKSVIKQDGTTSKFVKRYSSRIEADQKFFVYC